MRVRSIIRDMEAGDAAAWERAELKLSQPDVHEVNKDALRRALETLSDPRKTTPEPVGPFSPNGPTAGHSE